MTDDYHFDHLDDPHNPRRCPVCGGFLYDRELPIKKEYEDPLEFDYLAEDDDEVLRWEDFILCIECGFLLPDEAYEDYKDQF